MSQNNPIFNLKFDFLGKHLTKARGVLPKQWLGTTTLIIDLNLRFYLLDGIWKSLVIHFREEHNIFDIGLQSENKKFKIVT